MSRYDDIIDLPHHVSENHPPMSRANRAAQFSPFAALTGFGAVIDETARLTEEKIELDEHAKAELDETLRVIAENIAARPEVTVTYFVPDGRKAGGAYVTGRHRVKKLDSLAQTITMTDGTVVAMDDVCAIAICTEHGL